MFIKHKAPVEGLILSHAHYQCQKPNGWSFLEKFCIRLRSQYHCFQFPAIDLTTLKSVLVPTIITGREFNIFSQFHSATRPKMEYPLNTHQINTQSKFQMNWMNTFLINVWKPQIWHILSPTGCPIRGHRVENRMICEQSPNKHTRMMWNEWNENLFR